MTYTILAVDDRTGRLGGAAATGSLCVGGWVLRGDPRSGLSASQGTSPSTLWGEHVLDLMRMGRTAEAAVAETVAPDSGRDYRQLAALDPGGRTAAFTGARSVPACAHRTAPGVIVAGNMLASEAVLDDALDAFAGTRGDFTDRLMAALFAGERGGSDSRGLLSAALLVVGHDIAPVTLRVDYSETPLNALSELLVRTHTAPYSEWVRGVPTLEVPDRADC